jgi:ferrochelatase
VPDDGDIAAADDVHLVFSAHGVPVRVIEAGDPYQKQIEETVRLVMERGRWSNPHVLCWQSRVNPGKWLEPSLGETLRALSARRAERVLVIPISFVTDHVETLAEIDIEARALAYQAGIRQFELMPALNDSATFIRALADLVLAQLATPASAAAGRHNSPHSRP